MSKWGAYFDGEHLHYFYIILHCRTGSIGGVGGDSSGSICMSICY